MKISTRTSIRREGTTRWEQETQSFKPVVESISSEGLANFSKTKVEPADACIYCGSKDPNRSREHIIAYALGGNITIPKGSCEECQRIIHKFETAVLRGPMKMVRYIQSMPSRTKHRDVPQTVPLSVTVAGEKRNIQVPVDKAPILLAFPTFDEPRYLTGGNPNLRLDGTATGSFGVDPDIFARNMGAEAIQITSSGHSPVAFAQMVAKTAYANAYVQGQLHRVKDISDFLRAMLRNPNEIGRFVGTMQEPYIRRDGVMHYLGIHELRKENILYASVQFFANIGAPIYVVVLGRLKEAASQPGMQCDGSAPR